MGAVVNSLQMRRGVEGGVRCCRPGRRLGKRKPTPGLMTTPYYCYDGEKGAAAIRSAPPMCGCMVLRAYALVRAFYPMFVFQRMLLFLSSRRSLRSFVSFRFKSVFFWKRFRLFRSFQIKFQKHEITQIFHVSSGLFWSYTNHLVAPRLVVWI